MPIISSVGHGAKGIAAPIDQSCIGYWPLDEAAGPNVIDQTHHSNDGVATGCTFNQAGKFGKAVLFNAATDVITVADAAGFYTPSLATGFTVCVWIKRTGAQTQVSAGIAVKYNAASGSWYLQTGTTPYTRCVVLGNISASASVSVYPVLNEWEHWVGTLGVDGKVRLFQNGRMLITSPFTITAVAANVTSLTLGNYNNTQLWPGLLDDIRIYDRALSASEIAQLYMRGR